MKIQSSDVQLFSQSAQIHQRTTQRSIAAPPMPAPPRQVEISNAGQQIAKQESVSSDEDQLAQNPKLRLIADMVYALTGKHIKLFDPQTMGNSGGASDVPQVAGPDRPSFEQHTRVYEAASMSFSAQGTIKTADGQEIQFELNLQMSYEFVQEQHIVAQPAQRKDPLVVNFAGAAAQLTEQKFSFDLDSDGTTENISFVGANSGVLALDKNANGSIDNGSELFGANTGNGFAELAAYDQDGNHWIDETDAVYQQLRIWSKDAAGQDSLSSLAERNIGALYLANTASPFELKTANNISQGQVRSSSIYLQEDGKAGTVQQIDLNV